MMFGFSPIAVYAAAIGFALLSLSWVIYSIRQDARDDLIQKIERNENAVREKAIKGARNVDACYDAGGVWDRASGSCREPERGGR